MKITSLCIQCQKEFMGRPNKLYCSIPCRKKTGKEKERLKILTTAVQRFDIAIAEAREVKDFFEMRLVMGMRARCIAEIEAMEAMLEPTLKPTPDNLLDPSALLAVPVTTCKTDRSEKNFLRGEK